MANVLIVDDDELLQELLSEYVASTGNAPLAAGTLKRAFKLAEETPVDLVFLDVRLPDGNGLDALPRFRALPSAPEVIIVTGVGDAQGADLAIRSGAWDYMQKPALRSEVILQITRSLQFRESRMATRTVSLKRDAIVGGGSRLGMCLDGVAKAAPTDANVLITGETGTGKELFARTIHENSARAGAAMVVVDCAALPETLMESVLFGHAKGAFTGADTDRAGLVAKAHGGTLFLDEIGELSPATQKTFLRVLQERRYRPVGSVREAASDFRLVAATNRNLAEMVGAGAFRSDLLFRIRTFQIDLPPLRERREDIRELTLHFIAVICDAHRIVTKGFVPEVLDLLLAYDWPGNVRELFHTLENAVLTDPGCPTLYPMHLPSYLRIHRVRSLMDDKKSRETALRPPETPKKRSAHEPVLDCTRFFSDAPPLKTFRERLMDEGERQYFGHLVAIAGHDIPKLMALSGLGQARLYALLKKYGLSGKDR